MARAPLVLTADQLLEVRSLFEEMESMLHLRSALPQKPTLLARIGATREDPLLRTIMDVPVPRECVIAEIDRRIAAAGAHLERLGVAYHRE